MVNVGFKCTRSTICALNTVYMVLGVVLIGVAVCSKGFTLAVSTSIFSGVITLGVFLILIGILGLIGASRHHQILLFIYSAILPLVFLFQFAMSCTCFTFNTEQQEEALSVSWGMMDRDARRTLELHMDCCGLINSTQKLKDFSTDAGLCTAACKVKGRCFKCGDMILQEAGDTLKFLGGLGLFFSFSEILVVWLVLHYRNQKKPQTPAF